MQKKSSEIFWQDNFLLQKLIVAVRDFVIVRRVTKSSVLLSR